MGIDLAGIKASMQAGAFADAQRDARQLLIDLKQTEAPAETLRETLYVLAVACRYAEDAEQALAAQTELMELDPGYARIYQERGHLLLSQNLLVDAQRAYEKAVNLNPALVASWKALLNLYELHDRGLNHKTGKHQIRAQEQLSYLLSLPEPLLAVVSAIHEGRLFEADQICRRFLRENKTHIEGMRLLAQVSQQAGVLTDAQFLLETAAELRPDNLRVQFDLANLLLQMQKFEPALVLTEKLTTSQPDDLAYRALHANALAGVGDQEAAIEAYDMVLQASPLQPALRVMRGHAEKTIGNLQAAIASYQSAYDAKPDHGDAYWSLANTKSYQFQASEIEQMTALEADASTVVEDRIHLCFALGKAYEDRADYAASFQFYERGNALKQAGVRHRPEYLAMRASAQTKFFTREVFTNRLGSGCPDAAPIFIVGLPRAGSTLIEQILASHSQVDGTLELPQIIALAQRLRISARGEEGAPGYPEILGTLETDYLRRFGEQFIADTQVYRAQAPYFIDKNPNNFFHVGMIKLILPNAKIIDARRHPMSCCFSGFKQLFGQGQEFSYGLTEIGNYYREYVALMQHWDEVLPGAILRVQHEELVADLEGQVRRMLDYCGLDFEQSCLEYYKTDRSVRTPSSEQVRQPIFTSSLEAWKNFEPWLDPLKDALGPDLRREYHIE